jgi:hypothetical protein
LLLLAFRENEKGIFVSTLAVLGSRNDETKVFLKNETVTVSFYFSPSVFYKSVCLITIRAGALLS